MKPQILTANRLRDGIVVFLARDGGWSERIGDSRVADDETSRAELVAAGERAVAARAVVGPYLIEVSVSGGHIRAVRLRERIRAEGPTAGSEEHLRQG
ncbi:MAG: DUF2849 domain-containing protein [Defluviicoccus sp.]